MNGLLCYYSLTGNTKLACEYIKSRCSGINFFLYDITKGSMPDFEAYDLLGFAAFTDFGAPSKYFLDFLGKIPEVESKYAFTLNTYGAFSMSTQRVMKRKLEKKGYLIVNSFSLHMPENYPPLRSSGKCFDDAPDKKEFELFNSFLGSINNQINDYSETGQIVPVDMGKFDISSWIPRLPRFIRRKLMGRKQVDAAMCIECGTCEKSCNYNAVKCSPKPVFSEEKCEACWSCYNHCPKAAISTEKLSKKSLYNSPSPELQSKFK